MKVGVIGCGTISKFHVIGFDKAGCQLGWFCDVNTVNAENWAKQYPGSKVTADYNQVLADPDVKMVAVTVPTNFHKEVVTAAIKAGKAVICEKTLGMTSEEALEICKFAEDNNAWLATAYMKRYFPATQKAKQLIEEKGGRIVSVYAKTYQPSPGLFLKDPSLFKGTDAFLKEFLGGGVLVCGGSHIMDLLHWFCGNPVACCGNMDFVPDTEVLDRNTNAMFWFENGAVAHFEAYWHEYTKAGYEKNGWDESIIINMDNGVITLKTPLWHMPENNAAQVSWLDAVTGEYTEYRFDNVNAFHLQSIDEVKRFESGLQPAITARDGYISDLMIDAVKESSEKDAKVKITL